MADCMTCPDEDATCPNRLHCDNCCTCGAEETMSDLAEFLLARIAEDEAVARAATQGPWYASTPEWDLDPKMFPHDPHRWQVGTRLPTDDEAAQDHVRRQNWVAGDGVHQTDAVHIARWDPARVIAECEAKRLIVTVHAGLGDHIDPCAAWGASGYCDGPEPAPCRTLRLLAQPYADHPDCREEWRP